MCTTLFPDLSTLVMVVGIWLENNRVIQCLDILPRTPLGDPAREKAMEEEGEVDAGSY